MARQDLVEQRAQPHEPAAQARGVDLEGLDEVVGTRLGIVGTSTGAAPDADRSRTRHQVRMPFCACSRFSASSHTTDCGPSMTPAVTSSPRLAGRQCMKMASRLRLGHQPLIDAVGRQHVVTVDVGFNPHRHPGVGDDAIGAGGGLRGSVVSRTAALRARPVEHAPRRRQLGRAGQPQLEVEAHRRVNPARRHIVAVAAPGDDLAGGGPLCSSSVITSAMSWQGWLASVRPLITGTVA